MGPEGCLLMTIMFNCTQLWAVCFEKFWPHRKKFGWITFIVNLSLYLAFLLPFTALAVYLKANSLELCGYKFENMTKHRTGYYEHTWVSNSLFKCWFYVKEWVPQLFVSSAQFRQPIFNMSFISQKEKITEVVFLHFM